MEKINQLIELSRHFGANSEYIIAGGGNSSYKDNSKMWVKASGTSMATIEENGFVCLDRTKMQVISERSYSTDVAKREEEVKQDLHNSILFPEGKRPSVEASMHEIIPFAYVMHTHPTLVNGMLCAKNSKQVIEAMFENEVVYVPYTDPGYVLFKEVANALESFRNKKGYDTQIIFLENHGVFVGANTCDEINNIYSQIESKIKNTILTTIDNSEVQASDAINSIAKKLFENIGSETKYYVCDSSPLTLSFINDIKTFLPVSVPFTPDNIVYCKSRYLFLSKDDSPEEKINDFTLKHKYAPKIIAMEGEGIIAVEDNITSAQIVMDVFKDMMNISRLSESFGGPRPMTQEQIDFIDNWEVENYRRKMSKQS